jgi:hypothetical protein
MKSTSASRLERWRALPPQERLLLGQLPFLLIFTGALLRVTGLARTRRFLTRSIGAPMVGTLDSRSVATAHRIARLVSIASRHGPYRPNCLPQSLVLWWLLQRRRLPARLLIGVRRSGAALMGHAWVEVGRDPVGDPASTSKAYVPYELLEPPQRV